MKISIGVSGRHVHLKEEDYKVLFGDEPLIKKVDLKQPHQFAATNTVTVVGPKNKIENVRVLGPLRSYTQVEVAKTDAFKLGVNPPIRKSGDVEGSEKIKLIGPKGELDLEYGCIIPTRHIHISKDQLETYGLKEDQLVNLYILGEKSTILKNVGLSVSDEAYFEAHLDTDDANACLIKNDDIVDII